ncbi:iron permease FTR1 family protein [Niveomyces insectorum RCEF 264]|uniref:Iron permease FTR1 family protein n=1 Tax=Niveomyces insectorum RCEF 264 TaxID=1081102 RepID=A0A168AIK0_9HYPO|nr:iron permease FTR1 family protein [Niveomyces insectorum RCEF 264]
MAVDVFSVPVFLVVFRESLETVIIVSVLLAFLKQTLGRPNPVAAASTDGETVDTGTGTGTGTGTTTSDAAAYRRLVRQVWVGTAAGLGVCLLVATALIAVFYTLGADRWAASEDTYEGAFALVAALIISVVGAALLRIGRMQAKWRVKLAKALAGGQRQRRRPAAAAAAAASTVGHRERLRTFAERYALFVLPFVTVLREGIEAIVFVAGVSFAAPARSVPLPVVVGLLAGIGIGYFLYKGGSSARLQLFLVASTCLLYLVAAGLFSRAVWSFENQTWNKVVGSDAAELGSGPGSYDIDRSVWHVNCCNPELNGGGGWGFFNAILGWTNSATYGSVLAYNLYWLTVMLAFFALRFHEARGRWPLVKARLEGPPADAAPLPRTGGAHAPPLDVPSGLLTNTETIVEKDV